MKKTPIKQLLNKFKHITVMSDEEFIEYHKALSDNVRALMLKEICRHEGINGKELLSKFHISQPTLSFHINKLKKVNLIIEKRDGQSHLYYPNYEKILSFHKTTIEHHKELETILGDYYKEIDKHLLKDK